jgi:hypothetical protein
VERAWRELPWDTAFFGVGIGSIDLSDADEPALRVAEQQARGSGLRCLYGQVDPTSAGAAATLALVQRLGYRLVDVTIDLQHPTGILAARPPTTASVRVGTPDDVDGLGPLLDVLAPWSRFAVDARFGVARARDLHRAWIERAATGEGGRRLLVAEEDGRPTALLTLRRPAERDDDGDGEGARPEGRIDLVATTRPRSGAAQALVARAVDDFGPGPNRGGPIAARNLASLRFTEGLGYRAVASRYLFHRWLDEPCDPSAPGLRSAP